MKKGNAYGPNTATKKDPKEMSIAELNAYLSSKAILDTDMITSNSPKTNDWHSTKLCNQSSLKQSNTPQTAHNLLEANSKSAHDYIKSLQDRISSLMTENNEIKANFVQISEILNKERESRMKTKSCQSASNNHHYDNSDDAHQLAGYKNQIKSLFQDNRRLAIENENLMKENKKMKEHLLIIEEENKRERDKITNQTIEGLNAQINTLQYQLSQIKSKPCDDDDDNNNNAHFIANPDAYNLSNINRNSNRNINPKPQYLYNNSHQENQSKDKNKKSVVNPQIKEKKSKPNKSSLTPTRYHNSSDLYEASFHNPSQTNSRTQIQKLKGIKKKKKKSMHSLSLKKEKEREDDIVDDVTQFNSNRIPLGYNYNNKPYEITDYYDKTTPKFDYDIKANKVIVNTSNCINRQEDYYHQNDPSSFKINSLSSTTQYQGQTDIVMNEKERLNQLNQVVIRIQLLEQNIAQLKSSYQTFVSVLETGVTNEEELQIKDSMNRMASTLEENTIKLLYLKQNQQELLKKSLLTKTNIV